MSRDLLFIHRSFYHNQEKKDADHYLMRHDEINPRRFVKLYVESFIRFFIGKLALNQQLAILN